MATVQAKTNQKYVIALLLGIAGIVWLVTQHYVDVVLGYFQIGRTLGVGTYTVLRHGLPILFALGTFAYSLKKKKIYNFSADSVKELVQVVWPARKDVVAGTVVVISAVIVSGTFLAIADKFFSSVVRAIINA